MIACLFAVWNCRSNVNYMRVVQLMGSDCVWLKGLITIRVHALYGLSPRLKWILSFTFVSVEMATLYLSARESNIVASVYSVIFSMFPVSLMLRFRSDKAIAAHDIHTCIPGPIPKTFWTIWAPSVCSPCSLRPETWCRSPNVPHLTKFIRKMCYETTLFIMAMMKLVTRKRLMDSSLRRVLLR